MSNRPYNMAIRRKYLTQRHYAHRNGVEWNITYGEWLDWWGADLARRGNRREDLQMLRYNNTGPVQLDNIYKGTSTQRATYTATHKTESHRRAVSERGRQSRPLWTPDGRFDSIKSAALHYSCTSMTIRKRIANPDPAYAGWMWVNRE